MPNPAPRGRRRRIPAAQARLSNVVMCGLTGASVGAAWFLDSSGALSAPSSICLAGGAGAVIAWRAVRNDRTNRAASLTAARAASETLQARAQLNQALEVLDGIVEGLKHGRRSIAMAVEQVERGETPPPFPVRDVRAVTGNPLVDARPLLELFLVESRQAILDAGSRENSDLVMQADLADIFQSITPRLLSLVRRLLKVVTDWEKEVEDPDLLRKIFDVDHLGTQLRRNIESLAVLGGSTPGHGVKPVLVAKSLRGAVAEIRQYPRVRVAPPPPKPRALLGYVTPAVKHLLAELMENATRFSPPDTKVEVHTVYRDIGAVVTISDWGTGITPERMAALNKLLESPQSADVPARLRDGQIGILVAARLAERYEVTIRLRPTVWGGTQAVVVIPQDLLVEPQADAPPTPVISVPAAPKHRGPAPAITRGPSTPSSLPQRVPRALPTQRAHDERPQLPLREPQRVHTPQAAATGPTEPATSDLFAAFNSRIAPPQDPPSSTP